MAESNGSRKVTISELNDKLEVVNLEQKNEHFKTRIFVVVGAVLTGGTKIVTLLGLITLPHFF